MEPADRPGSVTDGGGAGGEVSGIEGLADGSHRPALLPDLPVGLPRRPLTTNDIPAVSEPETAGEMADDGVAEIDIADLIADRRRPDFRPGVNAAYPRTRGPGRWRCTSMWVFR